MSLVVGPGELQPGDTIVGVQKGGAADAVSPRSDTVKVGVGPHRTGGDCIQLEAKPNEVAIGHENNLWHGSGYDEETLFHISRF